MLHCKFPFPADWEQRLQNVLLHNSGGKNIRSVYVCSPLRGADRRETHRNMLAARFYMYFIWLQMKQFARAPHAYLPLIFCDSNPRERGIALDSGMNLLQESATLFVCGNRLSQGMWHEIKCAARNNIPVRVFHPKLYTEVRQIFTEIRADKKLLTLDSDARHRELGLGAEELFGEAPEDA